MELAKFCFRKKQCIIREDVEIVINVLLLNGVAAYKVFHMFE